MDGLLGIVHLGGAKVAPRSVARLLDLPVDRAPELIGEPTSAVLLENAFAARPESRKAPETEAVVAASARLDGRNELISALNLAGLAATADDPDSRLVAAAWRAWGRGCIERLDGDWVLAAWDPRSRELFCARDAFGIRPLYWTRVGPWFVLSTDMTPLTRIAGVDDELEPRVISDFLLFGDYPDPVATVLRGVHRVAPGHWLSASATGVQSERFFDLRPGPPVRHRDKRDYVREYLHLLEQATLDRTGPERAGIMLSGGTDSTALAMLAARQGVQLHGATLDARPIVAADREAELSREAAAAANVQQTIFEVLPEHFYEIDAPATPFPIDGAFMGISLRAEQHLGAHAHRVITGRGGDVALAGSQQALRTLALQGRFMEGFRAASRYTQMRGSLRGFGLRTLWRAAPEDTRSEFPEWIRPELKQSLRLDERLITAGRLATAPDGIEHDTAWSLLVDPMWPSSFEAERATAPPISYRHPFWDLRLLRWLLAIPPLPWCRGKTLHREAMRGLLPESLRQRPKAPLAGDPTTILLRDDNVLARALSCAVEAHAWVDLDCYRQALTLAAEGTAPSVWSLTAPISLGRWLADRAFRPAAVELCEADC